MADACVNDGGICATHSGSPMGKNMDVCKEAFTTQFKAEHPPKGNGSSAKTAAMPRSGRTQKVGPEVLAAQIISDSVLDLNNPWEVGKEVPWLLEPLIPKGQYVGLTAFRKTGKSLLGLEMALKMALGIGMLWQPDGEPIRVLYIDRENNQDEIYRRMMSMGFSHEDRIGDHLQYLSLPMLPPMNTPAGKEVMRHIIRTFAPQVVFLDSASKMVRGKESDTEMWQALFTDVILPMKKLGITVVQLDNTGKGDQSTSRGSSAKGDNLDIEWKLSPVKDDPGVLVIATEGLSRTALERDAFRLEREESPYLTHTLVETKSSVEAEEERVLDLGLWLWLAEIEGLVDKTMGRDRITEIRKGLGLKTSNNDLAEALRRWKP